MAGQAGATNDDLAIELHDEMLSAGVRQMQFWLDGAGFGYSDSWCKQIATSVFLKMAEGIPARVPYNSTLPKPRETSKGKDKESLSKKDCS